MAPSSPDYWRGYKRAFAAAGMPAQQPNDMYGVSGAAGGSLTGAALGATLGDLIAGQSKRHLFNIPIPGTQRLEDAHGRLLGGTLGAVGGGLAGHAIGQGYGDERAMQQQAALMRQLMLSQQR